jgi:hypothetical protein
MPFPHLQTQKKTHQNVAKRDTNVEDQKHQSKALSAPAYQIKYKLKDYEGSPSQI